MKKKSRKEFDAKQTKQKQTDQNKGTDGLDFDYKLPEGLLKGFQQIGKGLNEMQPGIAKIVESISICKDKPLCFSCGQRATNIRVKIINRRNGPKDPSTLSLGSFQRCTPEALLTQSVRDAVSAKIDKDFCKNECEQGCRCISIPIAVTFAHVTETRNIYTGENWTEVIPARAVCITKVEIDFDIQLMLNIGVCTEVVY
ncbi:MAG TPA: hypothetical protein VD905_09365 [Flavobacteriales bacterium]|nr:hypothetical protein [Flavobacteriales bacterium]